MSEIPDDFDFSLVFEALAPGTRAAVRRFTDQLGVPADAWPAIPSLRSFIVTAALLEVADLDSASNEREELTRAAYALGLSYAADPDTHGRRIRDWRRRAGDFLLNSEEDAA